MNLDVAYDVHLLARLTFDELMIFCRDQLYAP